MSLQARLAALATAVGQALKTRGLPQGGAVGQVLTKTGAGDFAAGWQPPGADPWTNIVLGAAFANSTTSATVTPLALNLAAMPANSLIEVDGLISLWSVASATAPRLGWAAAPAAALNASALILQPGSTTALAAAFTAGPAAQAATGAGNHTGTGVRGLAIARAMFQTGSAPTGTWPLTLTSEVAASEVRIEVPSFLRWRRVA